MSGWSRLSLLPLLTRTCAHTHARIFRTYAEDSNEDSKHPIQHDNLRPLSPLSSKESDSEDSADDRSVRSNRSRTSQRSDRSRRSDGGKTPVNYLPPSRSFSPPKARPTPAQPFAAMPRSLSPPLPHQRVSYQHQHHRHQHPAHPSPLRHSTQSSPFTQPAKLRPSVSPVPPPMQLPRPRPEQVRVCEERNATTLGRMDTAYFFLCGSLPSPRC